MEVVRIGTRGSPLALAQARLVRDLLGREHPRLPKAEIAVIKTTGDRVQDRALLEVGGKGLFTKEIEEALLAHQVDIAVHSMKDVPTALPEGLIVDCLPEREDPRDVLFAAPGIDGASICALPKAATVGTASLRRSAQLKARRPDLNIVAFRGNVDTRLRKLEAGEVDATILASAGLRRLGLADAGGAVLSIEDMLPAVAQGAIGIERRADDAWVMDLLAPLNCAHTMTCVTAERALLAALDGSCRTPIAALAESDGEDVTLRGLVAMPDGTDVRQLTQTGRASEPERLGRELGDTLRAQVGPAFFATLAEA